MKEKDTIPMSLRLNTETVEVISNRAVAPGYYRMAINWVPPRFQPGQFVMLRVSACYDPLLRRPFGIYNITADGIEILYRLVGKGTAMMSQLKRGDRVALLGPLGRGFELSAGLPHILVAGGIGIAPFYMVAKRLLSMDSKVRLLFGVRTAQELTLSDEIAGLGVELLTTVEEHDGRLVVELLKEESLQGKRVLACGPQGMLRAVAALCREQKVEPLVSVETAMACGMGICMGCVVKSQQGYRLACVDGPVFSAGELEWNG